MHTKKSSSRARAAAAPVLNPGMPGSMSLREMAEFTRNQLKLMHAIDLGPSVGHISLLRDMVDDVNAYHRMVSKVITHMFSINTGEWFNEDDKDLLSSLQHWLMSVQEQQDHALRMRSTPVNAYLVIAPDPDYISHAKI